MKANFSRIRLLLLVVVLSVSGLQAASGPESVGKPTQDFPHGRGPHLVAQDVALSVWDTDGRTVGITLQVSNVGDAAATHVQVSDVEIRGGRFAGPTKLPLLLSTIPPGKDSILNLLVKVPKTDGTRYRLTITGQYVYAKTRRRFSLNTYVAPQPVGSGPLEVRDGNTVIKHPSTASYPPPPPPAPFGPNAESPMLIPIGPARQMFPATPTATPADSSISGGSVNIDVNTSQTNAGTPPDPNAAASANNVVLSTYNTGISFSLDGGNIFTDVNLFTAQPGNPARTSFFPQDDGGLCCDQVVIHIPERNLFVWLLQYNPVVNAAGAITQPNRLRIAWATPEAIVANFANAWTYCDLTGNAVAGVSDGLGTASNEWLDYPDLAYSDRYLYVGSDHGATTPGRVYTGRRIVARLDLEDMADASATAVNYNRTEYMGVGGLNKDHFVQHAPSRMILGALKDTSTFRVFSWKDSDGAPVASGDIAISSITTDYTSQAPDGSDWYAVSFPGNVTGAAYRSEGTNQEYLFAFDGGRNADGGRAQPYVRIESLFLFGFSILGVDIEFFLPVAEYDIWNPNYAFAMAALGTQEGNIGMGVAVGGGTLGYPQYSVGYKDDFVVYLVTASNATQVTRFGDYFSVRPIAGTTDFATEGYEVLQAVPGSVCAIGGCNAVTRYIRFGRPEIDIN
jgi:hypothetical protein